MEAWRTLILPSSEPLTSQWPSGLKRKQFITCVWPLYVCIQPFRRTSHTCAGVVTPMAVREKQQKGGE